MPFEYTDSPYRCRCGKRLTAEYGQHEDRGDLVESHHCLSCGQTYNVRDRRLMLPEVSEPVPYAILQQWVERRTVHLDRPEVVARYADAAN